MTGKNKHFAHRVSDIAATVSVVGMTLLVVLDASMRGLFNAPVGVVLPLVQYWFMPVIVFVGFVLAQLENRHLNVDLIFTRFSPSAQRIVGTFGWLLAAVTAFAIARYSVDHALDVMSVRTSDPVTGLATWPTTFIVPVATTVLGLLFLGSSWRSARTGSSERTMDSQLEEL